LRVGRNAVTAFLRLPERRSGVPSKAEPVAPKPSGTHGEGGAGTLEVSLMRIDPAGWPFVIGGLLLAIVTLWLVTPAVGIVLLVLTTFFLFFFRDPERPISAPDTAVLSPADGRVMVAGE